MMKAIGNKAGRNWYMPSAPRSAWEAVTKYIEVPDKPMSNALTTAKPSLYL